MKILQRCLFGLLAAAIIAGCASRTPLDMPTAPHTSTTTPDTTHKPCVLEEDAAAQHFAPQDLHFGAVGDQQTPYTNVVADADSNVFDANVNIDFKGADSHEPPPISGWADDIDNPNHRVPAAWGDNMDTPAFWFPNHDGHYTGRMRIILPPGRYKIKLAWVPRTPSSAVTAGHINGTMSATPPNHTTWHPDGVIEAWLHRWRRHCP